MIVRSGIPTVTAIKYMVICSQITIGSSDNIINQKSSLTNGPCLLVAYIESYDKYKICKFTSAKRSQLIKCAAPQELLLFSSPVLQAGTQRSCSHRAVAGGGSDSWEVTVYGCKWEFGVRN